MQIDRYTKIVLTGILGCLIWLCAMHSGTPVDAQIGPTPVILAGYQTTGGVKSIELGVPVLMLSPRGETASLPLTGGPAAAPTAAATAPRPAAPPDQRQRCAATTQKGSQCSRLAQAGSRYCWQHGK